MSDDTFCDMSGLIVDSPAHKCDDESTMKTKSRFVLVDPSYSFGSKLPFVQGKLYGKQGSVLIDLYLYIYEVLGPGGEDLSGQWSVWCSH